ncbi:hypothetical protein [Motilimonas eburnea]|uniref:hypothetical protein n=1 Tax=Motilimonas eburnea TaxID=1737488 RepID=UPI001E287F0C|nr:hypothetical protein [Motilimonas eburnea]MCE2571889.1 hypothetical protein [Motilimonas eburnea]
MFKLLFTAILGCFIAFSVGSWGWSKYKTATLAVEDLTLLGTVLTDVSKDWQLSSLQGHLTNTGAELNKDAHQTMLKQAAYLGEFNQCTLNQLASGDDITLDEGMIGGQCQFEHGEAYVLAQVDRHVVPTRLTLLMIQPKLN